MLGYCTKDSGIPAGTTFQLDVVDNLFVLTTQNYLDADDELFISTINKTREGDSIKPNPNLKTLVSFQNPN